RSVFQRNHPAVRIRIAGVDFLAAEDLGPLYTPGDVFVLLQRIGAARDRKSTRLNSSHVSISYAVFCLKKKNTYISALCLWSLVAKEPLSPRPALFIKRSTWIVSCSSHSFNSSTPE